MPEYTPHQKKIIERYYDHKDDIMLAKLGDIVSDLYLAESAKKTAQLWKRAETAMENLKVPPKLMQHIVASKKPEVLAENLKIWLSDAKKKRK